MRRTAGAIVAVAAGVAMLAALGMWTGRLLTERAAPVVEAPSPTAPAAAVPALVDVLPYRPGVPLDAVGPFRLMDQDRAVVSDASLRGHYSLVFFGYTNCVQICAPTLENLHLTLQELGAAADGIVVYFITVDPVRDTRAVLDEYVRGLHPNVRALRGTEEQTEAALAAFGAARFAGNNPGDPYYAVAHTGVVFFLGRDGRYKLHFREAMPAHEMAPLIRANW
jgi:protein SCO1/2